MSEPTAPNEPTVADEARLLRVLNVMRALAARQLTERAPVSPARDLIDALAAGVNRLGDELAASRSELDRRVHERTGDLARANDELRQRALYDPLTDLPNQALFGDRLRHLLAGIHGRGGRLSVLVLVVESHVDAAQALGLAAADTLLSHVAGRLRHAIRPTDTAARIRQDTFAILLPSTGRVAAEQVAQRIDAALRRPINIDDREISPVCSIGVAVWESGQSWEDLLENADSALAAARRSASERYVLYQPGMREIPVGGSVLRSDLRDALDRGEIRLVYQPIVDLRNGRIAAVEALVRWRHQTRGEVSPDLFLPMAEEIGVMPRLGHWILETACRDVRRWQVRHPSDDLLGVHVDLAAAQIRDPDLPGIVESVVRGSGLAPGDLMFEVAESAVADDPMAAVAVLGRLHELGVRTAIDEFGTGHSSLTLLRQLPLDAVKIDRGIVRGIGATSRDRALLTGIVRLVQSLQLVAVADGVESPAHHAHLRQIGCELAQGSHYAPPAESEATDELLGSPPRPYAVPA
jgi:diguanylate cyclase (GGDEF)-like protein